MERHFNQHCSANVLLGHNQVVWLEVSGASSSLMTNAGFMRMQMEKLQKRDEELWEMNRRDERHAGSVK